MLCTYGAGLDGRADGDVGFSAEIFLFLLFSFLNFLRIFGAVLGVRFQLLCTTASMRQTGFLHLAC